MKIQYPDKKEKVEDTDYRDQIIRTATREIEQQQETIRSLKRQLVTLKRINEQLVPKLPGEPVKQERSRFQKWCEQVALFSAFLCFLIGLFVVIALMKGML